MNKRTIKIEPPSGFIGSPQEFVDVLTQAFVRARRTRWPYIRRVIDQALRIVRDEESAR